MLGFHNAIDMDCNYCTIYGPSKEGDDKGQEVVELEKCPRGKELAGPARLRDGG